MSFLFFLALPLMTPSRPRITREKKNSISPTPAPPCGSKPRRRPRQPPLRPTSSRCARLRSPRGGSAARGTSWLSRPGRSEQTSPPRESARALSRPRSSGCAACRERSPSRYSRRRHRRRAWPLPTEKRGAAWRGRWIAGLAAGFLLLGLDPVLLDLFAAAAGRQSAGSRRSSRSGGWGRSRKKTPMT